MASEPDSGTENYCTLFSKVRDNLSGSFGSQIDPLTRFSGLEVMCDHKAMVFSQNVGLRKPEIDDAWVARRSKYWSKTYCDRHPAFANAIRNGWTISTVFILADNSTLRIDAVCHDAEA